MTGVTDDTGALGAAERGERRVWARHRALLKARVVSTVPAPAVAQAWRGRSRQAQLARLLLGCAVDTLAGRPGADDIVDVCVTEGALRRGDLVISSDPDDLRGIAAAVNRRLRVERP